MPALFAKTRAALGFWLAWAASAPLALASADSLQTGAPGSPDSLYSQGSRDSLDSLDSLNSPDSRDSLYSGLGTALLPAESPALRERMRHPERLFLWEGALSVGPGAIFYSSPEWTRGLMWAGHIDPAAEWLSLAKALPPEPGRGAFRLAGGAEVGDGLYRELQGASRPEANRTPALRAEAEYAVLPQLRVRGLLDQNDVATYGTFSRRNALLKPGSDWSSLSYQGENLPTLSYALGEIHFRQRGGDLHAAFAHGHRWVLSPITGTWHPWTVTLTRLAADYGEGNGLYLDLAQWETPEAALRHEGKGLASEVGLRLSGGEDDWAWRLLWGYSRRTLEPGDSASFRALDHERFPFTFAAKRRHRPEAFPSLAWRTDMQASSRHGLLALRSSSFFGKDKGGHRPEIGCETFLEYRPRGATVARELILDTLSPATSGLLTPLGDFEPDRFARGAAAFLAYGWHGKKETADLRAAGAAEWGRPVFQAARPPPETAVRHGIYRPSDYALFNASWTAKVSTHRLPYTRLSVEAGLREFLGEEANRLEYRPAPHWAGIAAASQWPTDLSLAASVQAVGPKWVRGWPARAPSADTTGSADFRIAPHIEAQLGMRQGFIGNRFAATLQMLHAFGDELLEHPAGNPLRFRVLLGIEGRW